MYAIETINLTKDYPLHRGLLHALRKPFAKETIRALDNVSLHVERGELFGILGLNGAGKTTLIKILCSLILPTAGKAYVNGYDVESEDILVRKSIGFVNTNERSFYWRLTGRQNLEFFAALYDIKNPRDRIDELLNFLNLEKIADNRFDTYSTGMKHRMSIARGLLHDPEILFFDEPTAGLDVRSSHHIRQFIKEELVGRRKKTVILTTHNMKEAETLCDIVSILHEGRVKVTGTLKQIKKGLNQDESIDLEDALKVLSGDMDG
ncbi:MAG: ABC transporter ATP-binding protein [Candidatus Altiarchaeota archaeon]